MLGPIEFGLKRDGEDRRHNDLTSAKNNRRGFGVWGLCRPKARSTQPHLLTANT